jgi:hypothetical protein
MGKGAYLGPASKKQLKTILQNPWLEFIKRQFNNERILPDYPKGSSERWQMLLSTQRPSYIAWRTRHGVDKFAPPRPHINSVVRQMNRSQKLQDTIDARKARKKDGETYLERIKSTKNSRVREAVRLKSKKKKTRNFHTSTLEKADKRIKKAKDKKKMKRQQEEEARAQFDQDVLDGLEPMPENWLRTDKRGNIIPNQTLDTWFTRRPPQQEAQVEADRAPSPDYGYEPDWQDQEQQRAPSAENDDAYWEARALEEKEFLESLAEKEKEKDERRAERQRQRDEQQRREDEKLNKYQQKMMHRESLMGPNRSHAISAVDHPDILDSQWNPLEFEGSRKRDPPFAQDPWEKDPKPQKKTVMKSRPRRNADQRLDFDVEDDFDQKKAKKPKRSAKKTKKSTKEKTGVQQYRDVEAEEGYGSSDPEPEEGFIE